MMEDLSKYSLRGNLHLIELIFKQFMNKDRVVDQKVQTLKKKPDKNNDPE